MDLNLGRHCQHPDCGKLDFLPFQCPYCKLYFCLDHRQWSQHKCSNPPSDNNLDNQKKPKKPKTHYPKHKCCAKGCREKASSLMQCSKCGQYVCLAHRYHDTHPCKTEPTIHRKPNNRVTKKPAPVRRAPPPRPWLDRLFKPRWAH